MATVTLVQDDNQKVKSQELKIGKGIQEILYFPSIDPELGANENSDNTIQEVWVLEKNRLEKFLAETEKYDTAAKALAEAKLKLAEAKSEAEINAAKEEVVSAQDQMRATLAEGYGKKSDDSVMPIPQGSTKKLIECTGLVNKRTFYISMHELKKVKDTKEGGKRKFRFDTGEEYKDRKKKYLLEQFLTDSEEGKADDYKKEEKEIKKEEEKEKAKKDKNYVSEKWKKKFFKNIRSKIAEEWKFGEYETEGQLKTGKIAKYVKNDFVRDFLLTEKNCKLIDSYVGYLNDIANFSYQQKEQKLKQIKGLLAKGDDEFDQYNWGQVKLGVQQIWNATDRKTVERFNQTYEDYPKEEKERAIISKALDAYKLPEIYFDASGGAQFMRYSANCGGVAKFSLEEAKLAYKADAKFSLLEAGVEGNYYWPSNLGKKFKFNVSTYVECFDPVQLGKAAKGKNDTDPTFAHNSSFLLPSAVIDIAEQLKGLYFQKQHLAEQQELLIQVAGHADSSGEATYNTGISYLRANSTHALFTDDKAQWKEFFDKGIWTDEERDMIYLSMYMMQQQPQVFKERFENLVVGDKENLQDILVKELKVATSVYGYPVQQIQTKSIRTKIRSINPLPKPVEGNSVTIDMLLPMPEDEVLIEQYFLEMREYALKQVSGLDKSAFQLFYIDTDLHPILSYGEENLKIDTGKEEKIAANRRVTLVPWGVKKDTQKAPTEIDLGDGRVHIHGQVTGSVGATIGMSVNFELNTYNGTTQLLAKKKKDDKVAEYDGSSIKPTKLGSQNATAKANGEAFVGAKAEASISAALEWNNPEVTNKKFELLASVGGGLTGTAGAGIEGEFRIGFDQKTSTFQIKMKAVATWGLGGGGAWSFSVGVQQLFDFIKLVYHKLEENHFNFVDIFEDKLDSNNVETESNTNVYEVYVNWVGALWEQKEYFKAGVAATAGVNLLTAFSVLESINRILKERKDREMNEEKAQYLIDNIYADPSVLHFVPPEAKASMLYKIITFKTQSWSEFFSTDWFKTAEDAALKIILGISHWREWQETMEHLALNIDYKWVPYDKDKVAQDGRNRISRMNLNIIYLRGELLQNTKKWDIVRNHIRGLEGKDHAWNMNAMLWNTEKEKK